jgi:hypothetical protein
MNDGPSGSAGVLCPLSPVSVRSVLAAVACILLALTGSSFASENRYLFIVDTSFSMSRSSASAQQAVRELIEGGIGGQMQEGDTLGIWTFNAELYTGRHPMQKWSRENSHIIAAAAEQFLKTEKLEGQADFARMAPYLQAVVESSQSLLVILVTDGQTPVTNTPFDRDINTIFQRYHRELRGNRIPFVTLLAVRDGEMISYSVNSTAGPITLPRLPEADAEIPLAEAESTQAPAGLQQEAEEAEASVVNVATPEPPAELAAAAEEAVDVPVETAADSTGVPLVPREPPGLASSPIEAPDLVGTPIYLPGPQGDFGPITLLPEVDHAPAEPEATTGQVKEVTTVEPANAAPEPEPTAADSPASSTAPPPAVEPEKQGHGVTRGAHAEMVEKNEPVTPVDERVQPQPAVEILERDLPAQAAVGVSDGRGFSGWHLYAALGLFALAAALIWSLRHTARSKRQPSFISQSMDRH